MLDLITLVRSEITSISLSAFSTVSTPKASIFSSASIIFICSKASINVSVAPADSNCCIFLYKDVALISSIPLKLSASANSYAVPLSLISSTRFVMSGDKNFNTFEPSSLIRSLTDLSSSS